MGVNNNSKELFEEQQFKYIDRFKKFKLLLRDVKTNVIKTYKTISKVFDVHDMRPILIKKGNWNQRKISKIDTIIIHQELGIAYPNRSNSFAINEYHRLYNHWVGSAYHFSIDLNRIDLCNNFGDITYGAKNWNERSLHIVVCGDFAAPTHRGCQKPLEIQLILLEFLIHKLLENPVLPNLKDWEQVIGHNEATGKINCPGNILTEKIKIWRKINGGN